MHVFHIGSKKLHDQFVLDLPNNINVSFEFFPPSNEDMKKVFWMVLKRLSELTPIFISVTYSMNSGTRDFLCDFFKEIKDRTGLTVAPHLTCGDITLQELRSVAERYWNSGIRHIVALRGDTLNKSSQNVMYAVDLVLLLKEVGNFDISVAAYPEVHPEAISAQSDLIYLKKKIDAGANRAITQFFFDVEKYLRFRDLCTSFGITVPIVPGIFPIFNFHQLKNFLTVTKVALPKWILKIFTGLDSELETQKMIGVIIAMEMIKALIREDVKDFHFYTLNRFELTYAICSMLGLRSYKVK